MSKKAERVTRAKYKRGSEALSPCLPIYLSFLVKAFVRIMESGVRKGRRNEIGSKLRNFLQTGRRCFVVLDGWLLCFYTTRTDRLGGQVFSCWGFSACFELGSPGGVLIHTRWSSSVICVLLGFSSCSGSGVERWPLCFLSYGCLLYVDTNSFCFLGTDGVGCVVCYAPVFDVLVHIVAG